MPPDAKPDVAPDLDSAQPDSAQPDAAPDLEPDSGVAGLVCNIGGVCAVPLAADPSLAFHPMNIGEPALEFRQSITDDRWGTIHLFWYAAGAWHEKAIEHLPNASEANGQKWQLVRGVDYVCPSDGPIPGTWISCGTKGCFVPPIGETVHYAVVDNDGIKGKYTMRTAVMPLVWNFVRAGCES